MKSHFDDSFNLLDRLILVLNIHFQASYNLDKWTNVLHLCGSKMVAAPLAVRQELADAVLAAFQQTDDIKQPHAEMHYFWLRCSFENEHFVDVRQYLKTMLQRHEAVINKVCV